MSKIIIYNRSKISDYIAIERVRNVMSEGRVSNNDTQYCYVTVFPTDHIVIATDRTKTGTDKFYVVDHKRS